MNEYFIKNFGYVTGSFKYNGIQYPSKWLDNLSEEKLLEFGAYKKPSYNSLTQVIEKTWPVEHSSSSSESENTGWYVRDKTEEELNNDKNQRINSLLKQLWTNFNDWAEKEMDSNSRHSINLMINDLTTTQIQLNKINEYGEWWRNLWNIYASRKAQLMTGDENTDLDPSEVGHTPYTIWEISE